MANLMQGGNDGIMVPVFVVLVLVNSPFDVTVEDQLCGLAGFLHSEIIRSWTGAHEPGQHSSTRIVAVPLRWVSRSIEGLHLCGISAPVVSWNIRQVP